MSRIESILADAAQLPNSERIQLIEALWDMVGEDGLPPLSAEWLAEIKRRSAEFDAGAVTPIPWSEVKANALKRLEAKEE